MRFSIGAPQRLYLERLCDHSFLEPGQSRAIWFDVQETVLGL